MIPDLDTLLQARERIRRQVHTTPVLTCRALNHISGAELYFKCENFQKVGAFKFRGASNAILSLDENQARAGVATHSSGNHAAAVALAARLRGIPAHIVMPETAPEIKKRAVQGYGAQITFCEPTIVAREQTLERILTETGATLVHPYNDHAVIAGQATAALELLEQLPQAPDFVLSPIGGGGLISGTALVVHYLAPNTKAVGSEPRLADDAARSFRSGEIQPPMPPKTIADGLLTCLGDKTFAIIRENVHDILTVSEKAIVTAMRMTWERMKIIIEPSSAVPLAAVLEHPDFFRGSRTAIILTGGNADLDNLPWLAADRLPDNST